MVHIRNKISKKKKNESLLRVSIRGIMSNYLEEISSLSHSIIFLYFFALIYEEGFLISPCYSLELCIQMGIYFLSPLPSLCFFSQLFVRPPQTAILLFYISFSWGWS